MKMFEELMEKISKLSKEQLEVIKAYYENQIKDYDTSKKGNNYLVNNLNSKKSMHL